MIDGTCRPSRSNRRICCAQIVARHDVSVRRRSSIADARVIGCSYVRDDTGDFGFGTSNAPAE
jgi:hypothetical protein